MPSCILIVDDNELNREILCHQLRGNSYDTLTAGGGQEAVELAKTGTVDLILLDVVMPDIDGFETLKRLRKLFPISELPIIMITALSQSKDIIRALSLGANDYITKPIDTAVALARIKTQLHLRESERALRESQERYALAAAGANDGLWDWELQSQKIYFSPRWKSMLGFDDDTPNDTQIWFDRIHPDDKARVQTDIQRHLTSETENFASEYRILHTNGSYIWVFCRGIAVRNTEGKPYRMAGSQTDITHHGMHDALTGLPKRSLFLHSLSRSAKRHTGLAHTCAVLYLDLDRFKMINDSFGHQAGDEVLIEVGRRLDNCIKPRDTLARLEGDDFAILQSELESEHDAIDLARQIQRVLAEPQRVGEHDLSMEVSIGIAYGGVHEDKADNLLRNAHTALFHAKSMGSGNIDVFDKDMHQKARARLTLETNLRRAVRNLDFSLCYQPQIDLKTRQLVGLEALIRWKDEELGTVSPTVFIPIAEELGLIGAISEWVLDSAISEAKSWEKQGLPAVRVAINLSPKQFNRIDLVDQIRSVLKRLNYNPSLLDIEITESVLMDDNENAVEILKQLHDMGARISIDDFGTGYSSLGYLKSFPIDCIKIDKSFVLDIINNADDAAITAAIVAIAHNLHMSIIAEGVESEAHVAHLLAIGCEEGQGHFFSYPLDSKEIIEYLRAIKKPADPAIRAAN